MKYQITYEDGVVEEDFTKLDGFNRQRIIKEIGRKLSTAPNQFGRPLRGELKGYRRLRVGNYRVIYRVDRKRMMVLVVMVIHRESEYKGVERRTLRR